MSCSLSCHLPKALPSLKNKNHPLSISSKLNNLQQNSIPNKKNSSQNGCLTIASTLGIQVGAFLATVAEPALALTGVNEEEDLTWILIQSGISAFIYFIVCPVRLRLSLVNLGGSYFRGINAYANEPIIMNWLRVRWYRRKLLEMYLQFMFVFLFFPGLLLWAPFVNFRRFPRDPSMKYPWSTPADPSSIKNDYLKYPWATPEDYDQP